MSVIEQIFSWLEEGARLFELSIIAITVILCPCLQKEKDPEDVVCFQVADMQYFI